MYLEVVEISAKYHEYAWRILRDSLICHTFVTDIGTIKFVWASKKGVFIIPGVAGNVLQTESSLIE